MGVQLPQRTTARLKRGALILVVGASLLLLGACSEADKNNIRHLAFPGEDPRNATDRTHYIYDLWKWGWVAAMITGVIVWGLMFYVMARYRRRHDDEVPVQTRYNLPLEIFYTFVPIVMVIVFFTQTVKAQNGVLEPVDNPDHVVDVLGQKWNWTFNYSQEEIAQGKNVYEFGTPKGDPPTLVLPKGESVQFNLHSQDVVHSFWITGFLMKLDVVPGRVNTFYLTPQQTGHFDGKCAELCGYLHSKMLFDVEVVEPEEYEKYLQSQIDAGYVSDEPLLGNDDTTKVAGLDTGDEGGHE